MDSVGVSQQPVNGLVSRSAEDRIDTVINDSVEIRFLTSFLV